MSFPETRPRRLRRTASIRSLVRETSLAPSDLIWPLFFAADLSEKRAISTMPGVFQHPISDAAAIAKEATALGLGGVLLFGVPSRKDPEGRTGCDESGPVPQAIRELKRASPELVVMADVCVDEYTDHGHCGIVRQGTNGTFSVDNDATLEVLAEMASVFAKAGADVVAPSDMMDGRIGRIRHALDHDGLSDTLILSYAIKYASAFYGPFREAADCAPKFGDRSSYQMDPGNRLEGLREAALDEEEGADMLMVKPALAYLDVLRELRDSTTLPVGAYHVSGEYSMVHAAASAGMLSLEKAMMESLLCIRRAGADFIFTYFAPDAARVLG